MYIFDYVATFGFLSLVPMQEPDISEGMPKYKSLILLSSDIQRVYLDLQNES